MAERFASILNILLLVRIYFVPLMAGVGGAALLFFNTFETEK